MGSCQSQELKVVFIGQCKSGKTAIIYHLSRDKFVQTVPTIGVLRNEVRSGKISLLVTDVAQLPRFSEYLPDADVVVFVYDVSDPGSTEDQLLMLESSLDVMATDPSIPILILVNKVDIANTSIVDQEKLLQEKLEKIQNYQILRTSALTGENIQLIPQTLVNLVNHKKAQ